MSLTICFVVYNEEKNLSIIEANLKEILCRTDSVRTLIIDNGSTDGSSLPLEQLAKTYLATYIKRQDNHLPQARQQALDGTTTPWIGFIDADCRMGSQWIPLALQKIATPQTAFSAFGGPWRIAGEWAVLYQSLFCTFLGHFGLPYLNLKKSEENFVDHLPTANIVYDRARLIQIGGFSSQHPHVGEDLDVSYRLQRQNQRILFVPSLTVEHYLPAKWSKWTFKMFLYGVARGQSLWSYRDLFKAKSLLPFLFCGFFVLSLISFHPLSLLAMTGYLALCLAVSFLFSPIAQAAKVFLLMLATHLFYSLGVVFGFFQALFESVSLGTTGDRQFRKEPKVENVL